MNEAATETQSINTSGVPRKCVACGYNLTGLGEEPRCPECGLLNVPEALRQQVWELVDSGKWFFSRMFGPFQKRLPGWWWALDRPGDVKRSVKAAVRNVALAVLIVGCAGLVSTATQIEQTDYETIYDANDPTRTPLAKVPFLVNRFRGPFGRSDWENTGESVDWANLDAPVADVRFVVTTSTSIGWTAPSPSAPPFIFLVACMILTWAVPAFVGLATQIRKGLPKFARAPRTILAAANYESHRLVYLSLAFVILASLEIPARNGLFTGGVETTAYGLSCVFGAAFLALIGAVGWVGPLRSDYTRQLVRSWIHAVRIVLMYALAIPWFVSFTLMMAWWLIVE